MLRGKNYLLISEKHHRVLAIFSLSLSVSFPRIRRGENECQMTIIEFPLRCLSVSLSLISNSNVTRDVRIDSDSNVFG